jgi:hypothetical protein
MPYKDPIKAKECARKYRQSEKGRLLVQRRNRKHRSVPENREKARQYQHWYVRTETGRIAMRRGLLKKYGLTPESYTNLLEKQKGVCAICGLPPIPNRNFDIDHDHNTRRVRGLVHRRCNYKISIVEQHGDVIQAYLRKFQERIPILYEDIVPEQKQAVSLSKPK